MAIAPDVIFGVAFEPSTIKTFVIYVIVILFTIGAVSILLTPDDDNFDDAPSDSPNVTSQDASTPKPEVKTSAQATSSTNKPSPAPKKYPVATSNKTPVKSEEPPMSPSRTSTRKRRKPAYFEPGSPK